MVHKPVQNGSRQIFFGIFLTSSKSSTIWQINFEKSLYSALLHSISSSTFDFIAIIICCYSSYPPPLSSRVARAVAPVRDLYVGLCTRLFGLPHLVALQRVQNGRTRWTIERDGQLVAPHSTTLADAAVEVGKIEEIDGVYKSGRCNSDTKIIGTDNLRNFTKFCNAHFLLPNIISI